MAYCEVCEIIPQQQLKYVFLLVDLNQFLFDLSQNGYDFHQLG